MVDLRAYCVIDSLQPQFASFQATVAQGFLPVALGNNPVAQVTALERALGQFNVVGIVLDQKNEATLALLMHLAPCRRAA